MIKNCIFIVVASFFLFGVMFSCRKQSTDKEITQFSFMEPLVSGVISDNEIFLKVPVGTDVTALAANFISNGSEVVVGTVSQTSKSTINNFTNPVVYTVTAEDGSTSDYTIFVNNYNLRDKGPAGGWIAYINQNAEVDGWKYLECAPYDLPPAPWINKSLLNTKIGCTSREIGKGWENSKAIVMQPGHTESAAQKCLDLSINGYDDWFLPSEDELLAVCWNLRGIEYKAFHNEFLNPELKEEVGGLAIKRYYTSTECTEDYSWIIFMLDGSYSTQYKWEKHLVRAVRTF